MNILEVLDIKKSYKRGKQTYDVLSGISFSLESGIVALRGKSGSGKSTLLNIIGNLDKPTSGTIKMLNQNVSLLNDKQLSDFRLQNIGFVFQQFNLIAVLTAFQNIEYPLIKAKVSKQERHKRVLEIANLLEIEALLHSRPQEMSGGQQQRVAIARAFINNPKIILADEPTANLDLNNTNIVLESLKNLVKQNNILALISTHDDAVANKADSIIKIQDGRLAHESV